VTKILVLPALPTAEPFRSQSVALLKERGVDAIISFRAMLTDLIDKIESNQNYSKSDTLQVMRILKNYDLIKDTQLELPVGREPTARKLRAEILK
jgi:predicted FMN-binding regulatory protein PaiB